MLVLSRTLRAAEQDPKLRFARAARSPLPSSPLTNTASLAQCCPPPHVDVKLVRRLTAIAHQMPMGKKGQPLCIRFQEGSCSAVKCKYAHEKGLTSKELKKFAPLINFVCECEEGGKEGKSESEFVPGTSPKKEGDSFSLGTTPPSDFMMSETPPKAGGGGGLPGVGGEGGGEELIEMVKPYKPLRCDRLLSLCLDDMSGVTAVVMEGECLSVFKSRRCRSLSIVSLRAPNLKVLDVSECGMLSAVPLHEKSMRGLRVAKLSGCRKLGEDVVGR